MKRNETKAATATDGAAAEKPAQWFDIDRAGLQKIIRRKGVEFAAFELVQNAWDEEGVNEVDVMLHEAAGTDGYALLTVTDNSPEGFKNLTHAYTLFADSAKKGNAEQRGRFNLGEKLVLSLCDWAVITTTKGEVTFDKRGRTIDTSNTRIHGTTFKALLKMSAREIGQVDRAMKLLLPPAHIATTYNGTRLATRSQGEQVEGILPTEIGDADGNLKRSRRKTVVHCYPVAEGEKAWIYEMGIPVVTHDCAWHTDVLQKVPLTIDRENVTPDFLEKLRVLVFNGTHAALSSEQANARWAQAAIEHPDAKPEAVKDYMDKRFGQHRVSFDMNDPEANNRAVANGYTLVKGGMLSGAAWRNVKSIEAIAPAGQIFPTQPNPTLPREHVEPTYGMMEVAEYAKQFARETLDGVSINVVFTSQASNEAASYGGCELNFNVRNLGGEKWFDLEGNIVAIDDLIIHELAHHLSSNHLSEAYYNALTKIGARALEASRRGRLPHLHILPPQAR